MNSSHDMSILVSVIIPAFNVEKWIEQTLDSVLSQSYTNLELIVIDDGSTDGTWQIIQRIANSDSRLRALHQENQGLSAVRNKGIQVSTGSVVFFLDSDDWIHLDAIRDVVKLFRDLRPDVVFIKCAKYFDGAREWSSGTDDFYWRSLDTDESRLWTVPEAPQLIALYPLAQLKVMSKSFLISHKLTFIDGLKYEDNPFHVCLLSLNPRCALLPKRYYAWRQGQPEQITAQAHIADCLIAVRKMSEGAEMLASNAFPFLLVAITRLVGGVASKITADSERLQFMRTAIQTIHEAIEPMRCEAAADWIQKSSSAHPGDRLMVRALFKSPSCLASALGSGANRYWATIKMLFVASRTSTLGARLRFFSMLLINTRLLVNYSKGTGECRVNGLG